MARRERAYDEGYDDGYEDGRRAGRRARSRPRTAPPSRTRKTTKPKRKLTAHNRFMKKEMKALRRKHPRMKQPQIMKKANVAWRKHKRSKR